MIKIHKSIPDDLFTQEPTLSLFKNNEYICFIFRHGRTGYYNAYVGVPLDRPLAGLDYDYEDICNIDIDFRVDWSRPYAPYIDEDIFADTWWLGFTTDHIHSTQPYQGNEQRKPPFKDEQTTYRDFKYVKQQVIKLSEELSKII